MLCDMCGKREAIVFIHQVGAGEKKELHLCSHCAYEHGLTHLEGDVGKALAELLKSLSLENNPASGTIGGTNRSSITKQKKKYPDHCPKCGVLLQDIKNNPLAGCEMCWNTYGELLLSSVIKQGRSDQYRGRFSVRLSKAIAKQQERERLQQLLQTAVAVEDYEQAAAYRDQLKLLEQGASDHE